LGLATPQVSIASAGTHNVTITNVIPGTTVYYAFKSANSSGTVYNTWIPPQTLTDGGYLIDTSGLGYTARVNDFKDAGSNFSRLAEIIQLPYTDIIPVAYFLPVIWILIFGALFLRQEKSVLVMMTFLLMSYVLNLMAIIPMQISLIMYLLTSLGLAGTLWILYKGR
jgi:hypothetical protein